MMLGRGIQDQNTKVLYRYTLILIFISYKAVNHRISWPFSALFNLWLNLKDRQTTLFIIDIYVVEWTGTYGLNEVPTQLSYI